MAAPRRHCGHGKYLHAHHAIPQAGAGERHGGHSAALAEKCRTSVELERLTRYPEGQLEAAHGTLDALPNAQQLLPEC